MVFEPPSVRDPPHQVEATSACVATFHEDSSVSNGWAMSEMVTDEDDEVEETQA
jgi:hypothetical protein